MSEGFDPYLKWLGIRTPDRPPNHYALLGLSLFEDDREIIAHAADRQMAHVRRFQAGSHVAQSQRILNELAAAKLCLLRPEKKAAYDARLRERLAPTSDVVDAPPVVVTPPAFEPPAAEELPVARPVLPIVPPTIVVARPVTEVDQVEVLSAKPVGRAEGDEALTDLDLRGSFYPRRRRRPSPSPAPLYIVLALLVLLGIVLARQLAEKWDVAPKPTPRTAPPAGAP